MKKILIDLTSLDDNFTGMEHYALYITKELIKNKDFEYELIFKNKISYFEKDELKNIKATILYGKRYSVLLHKLPKYINKVSPDYAIFLAFPPSFLWKPHKKIKVFSTIHDLVCYDVPNTMKWKSKIYFRRSIKHAIKISNKIIVNSNFTCSRIIDKFKYNSNDIVKAYCASSMPIVKKDYTEIKNKYNLPSKYILGLSTVEPRKNFEQLIEWMCKIWKENPLIPDLVLVGRNGWKQEKILKNVPNDLINRIHFTGFANEEDIYSLYNFSETFVFPSIYEGFGIPLLEALEANKLPICSKIPVFEEILGKDYPYMFNLNSYDDFKLKLYDILYNRYDLNYDNVIFSYSWIASAENILKII